MISAIARFLAQWHAVQAYRSLLRHDDDGAERHEQLADLARKVHDCGVQ